MDLKEPFNKDNGTKISFYELVKLIDKDCDYRFAIIDNEIDEELIVLAKKTWC